MGIGKEREKQIKRKHYQSKQYLNDRQWMTYLAQINYVRSFGDVDSILEIGCGGGVVNAVLNALGYNATTLDINSNLHPQYVGDISEQDFSMNEAFDLVLCAEVLEHIPFEKFDICINNIYEITKSYAVITLPNCQISNRIKIIINSHEWQRLIGKRKFHIQKMHYWELNSDAYTTYDEIRKHIRLCFDIVEEGIEKENPYHYYYLLKKKEK